MRRANLCVFDLCHLAPLKRGCANSGGLGSSLKKFCCHFLDARLRGRTATQRSKKGSGKGFWGRGSRKGSEKGVCYGF